MIDNGSGSAALTSGQAGIIRFESRNIIFVQANNLGNIIELFQIQSNNEFGSRPIIGVQLIGQLALLLIMSVDEFFGSVKYGLKIKVSI